MVGSQTGHSTSIIPGENFMTWNLESRQGREAPHSVILILWINITQSNTTIVSPINKLLAFSFRYRGSCFIVVEQIVVVKIMLRNKISKHLLFIFFYYIRLLKLSSKDGKSVNSLENPLVLSKYRNTSWQRLSFSILDFQY